MPDKDLRLLALDGGGVRGLSVLIILQQLMERIDPENPPKPCDYFDMIGGTGTSGLIAIMLGRLEMSIDDCIDAYLSLSDQVFKKKAHRATVKGNTQGRFDSEELVRAVKEVVTTQGLQEDVLLKDVSESACKVFVCATSKGTSETTCLTSYKSPRGGSDLLNSVKIWEACRATSAASSFFGPIAVGQYNDEFVDGATGANNPIWEVWNQAQLVWGPQALEGRIRCIVSIGTGIPSLKPFRDNVLHIGETFVTIAIETEQTAERFRQDKSHLEDNGQYYRFNVDRGLEEIGLEELNKRKEIAAATRRYVQSQDVLKKMQACADNMAGREYFGEYRISFSLDRVPTVSKFVGRPAEMAELERVLLPERQSSRRKTLLLHGLGGIGKTQLAIEFARQNHYKFSAVFWLDGRSEDSLKRSIVSSASRIPEGHISKSSRIYPADSHVDIEIIIQGVLDWLARQNNTGWLLIFDNVDREHSHLNSDPDAYDVTRYFPSADHGSILITTRLAKLELVGHELHLGKVDKNQAEAILRSQYTKHDPAEVERLLELLEGLPLAIGQAGAYLRKSGVGLKKYLKLYEQCWKELIESQSQADALASYLTRSLYVLERISSGDFFDPTETATAMSRDSGYASMISKQLLEGEFNASDTKSIASLESNITSTSSLNPAGVGGVAEELAEILWDNEEIRRCVKRGFVAMDCDRFERNFIRLLKSYASDLRAEADSHFQKSATRIVQSYRAYVTRIIRRRVVGLDEDDSQAIAFHRIKDQTTTKLTLERFLAQQQPTEAFDQVDTRPEDEQESNADSHPSDEEPYLPNLEKLTDFLVSSTAFKNFKARLETFVKSNSESQQTLEDSPSRIRKSGQYVPMEQPNGPGFLKWVKNALRRSLRTPIPPGYQRIEWICDCGDLLHMDFNSNSTGSFPTMNALLRFQSATLRPSGSSHAPSQPLPGALSIPMQARSRGNISLNLATQSGPVSGLHSANTPPISLGAPAAASTALTPLSLIFLELCVNTGKFLKSLGEVDVTSINTDGDFFGTVKAHYFRLRGFRARFWLLKPITVSYVRFSVEDRCRVGILHKPVALPPKTEVDAKRYLYNPCPLENELPISSDLFLHYLFSCSSPSHNLIWLPRIPRKLDTSILASPAPASFGWGVHIEEGPDYLKIFMLNLVVLGASGGAALLWVFFKHDFQGAMGLAAWIVMLLNTLMAVFVAKWSQE